jgi:hypothetical protein
MPRGVLGFFTRELQSPQRVLSNRTEQTITRHRFTRGCLHHGLVHELRKHVQHIRPINARPGADVLGHVESPAAGKDG